MATTNLGRVSIVPKGAYNSSTAYKRQDLVTYDNNTYLAIADSTGVPVTNTAKWLKLIDTSNIDDVTSYIADTYSSSVPYNVGDQVIHEGNLYECTSRIAEAEQWTAEHWIQTNIGDKISDFTSVINATGYAMGAEPLIFRTGYYSAATSSIIGETATFTGESIRYKCTICPCQAGDVFNINVYGPTGIIRGFFLCDANMTIIACADGNTQITGDFIVPDNENIAYVIFNHDTKRLADGYYAMKGNPVSEKTKDISEKIDSVINAIEYAIGAEPLIFKTGYYSTPTLSIIGQTATFTGESIRYKCAICPCQAGDVFSANVHGPSGVIRTYFLCDANMTVIACADGNTQITGDFIVPDNEDIAYIIFNNDTYRLADEYYAVKGYLLINKTEDIDKKIDNVDAIMRRVINTESFADGIMGKHYQITRGYYSVSDGTTGSDIHYAKTYTLTKFSNKALYVTVGDGYKFSARFWDENNNFVASKNTGYVQDMALFVPEGWTVAFNFENDDVTELGSSDYEAIASSLHIYTENHGFLQTVVEQPIDFNNLKTTGTYRFPSGQSEPNTNQPTNDYGRLIVFNSDDLYTCVQVYVSYNNDAYSRVLKRLDQDTWTSWKNINATTGAVIGLYLRDGEMFRLKSLPDPIPVGENHMGYNDFISSTWETLLPDGYQEGDAYNANTTKIINVNVERESRWTSTAYGANQDTYTIYRYIFTPQYGYKKTILLTAGCHGNEAEGYWSLYRLIRMIYFEGYKYPTLRNLKAVRIIVIPSWNPWGFQHYRRYNAFSALNTGSTDRAKSLQAWRWLYEPTHQVTVDGTLYDISDIGEANVIWETLNEFSGNLDLWLDMHTDPYAGRTTVAGEIDDPRGKVDPYGIYGFTRINSSMSERLVLIMEDFYNILRNEYNFTEKWHIELLYPNSSGSGGYSPWVASLNFPSAVAEISTFMNGFPYASGSAEMMKLAMEYYGNCIAYYIGADGW